MTDPYPGSATSPLPVLDAEWSAPTAQNSTVSPMPDARSERPLQALIDDFKGLPFDVLFPVRRWLGDQPWKMRWVQALLLFALFPLTLSHLWGIDAEIHDAAWALGIYFALLWGYVLWALVQPGQLKRRNIVVTSAFTAIVGVLLVLTLQQFPIISALYDATEWSFSPFRLIGFVAGVGLLEEAAKLLPVFWLAAQHLTLQGIDVPVGRNGVLSNSRQSQKVLPPHRMA